MSLHVWDEKKLKMLTLTIGQKVLHSPVFQIWRSVTDQKGLMG